MKPRIANHQLVSPTHIDSPHEAFHIVDLYRGPLAPISCSVTHKVSHSAGGRSSPLLSMAALSVEHLKVLFNLLIGWGGLWSSPLKGP